ncbi:HK97 gp10 family phage protein [Weissella muntiaci]|uniref:HK97 gp10 family phage protein n=1 Tax=Weissella muntiaci TaxID=2508881 RepID=A0A6C2C9Y4_9LACO|nr:HK97 gp10 family phage protein [Weissella muntiaci]TYC50757.1 HK97 gp10 family phage protein [Weissella muntiaci]
MAEEMSFEDILNAFVKEAEDVTVNMSVEDKAKITKAGAEVFKSELETVTKDKHYRERQTGKNPHLADSVIVQNTNIDGMKNGSSVVGWDKKKAYVGNFIENGTKFPMYTKNGRKYKHGGEVNVVGDHFVRNVRESPAVQQKMLEAEAKAYGQIIKDRGGN